MAKQKGKGKEVFKKIFNKVIKPLAKGIIDSTPLTVFYNFFDTNKDGKVTGADLAKMEWWKIIGSIAGVAILIHYDILSLEVFKELFTMLLEGLI